MLIKRVLSAVETTAALAIAVVAGLIFLTAVLRYVFSINLPDSFDFARYLQGIAILWGLAVATWRDGHITVDLVAEMSSPRWKRIINIFATAVTAGFFCVFAWALFDRLPSFIAARELTSDLRIPIWPFYLVAIGGVLATASVSILALITYLKPAETPNGS